MKSTFLNSDGKQFHQYQQSKQQHLTSTNRTQKKTMTYADGNPGPGLGQAQHYGRVKPVNEI